MPYSHLPRIWPTLPGKKGKDCEVRYVCKKNLWRILQDSNAISYFTFSCSHPLHSHTIKWIKLVLFYPLEFPCSLCTAGWTRNPGKWGVCSVIGSYRSNGLCVIYQYCCTTTPGHTTSPITILRYYINPTHQSPCAAVMWKPLGVMMVTHLQTLNHPNHSGRTEEDFLWIKCVNDLSRG